MECFSGLGFGVMMPRAATWANPCRRSSHDGVMQRFARYLTLIRLPAILGEHV